MRGLIVPRTCLGPSATEASACTITRVNKRRTQQQTFIKNTLSKTPNMEHLPAVPTRTVHGLETVPYVCKKSYDREPFLTYPIRENKPYFIPDTAANVNIVIGKSSILEYERLYPTPNKDFEAFCQTWLFFGLINEFLGDFCNSEDFVRPEPAGDGRTLSTSRLPELVRRWLESIEDGSSTITYDHIAKCLYTTFNTLKAAGPEFDLRVKFCIASIGELFEYAANKAFNVEDEVLYNKCPATWRRHLGNTSFVERLERSGWCPSQIDIMMRSSTTVQSLHFFASMQNFNSAERHRLCNTKKCVAYQTDLEDYKTQHATTQCECKDLNIDISDLNAVLATGALPLLRIREAEKLEELTMEIVASQPDSKYLALSHVWADGLGNSNGNALPRCQLLQLSKLTENLRTKLSPESPQAELLFWCDTLLCPTAAGAAKSQVLKQMREIYEQATCVLVLDASLRLCESEAMGPEETCARIIASGWMRRLWTFQEGALSTHNGRLWFQFRDQAVNSHYLWQNLKTLFNSDMCRRGLALDILGRMRTLMKFFHRETGANIATVEKAFEHRSVSVPSDEPLLIGTLLGLDVAGILDDSDGSNETRVHRMWSLMSASVHGIPKSILFRLGPRLKEEGYRWAPSSLLDHEDDNAVLQTMLKNDDQGTRTEHGLMVRLPGHNISFPQRPSWLPVNAWNIQMDEKRVYMRDDEAFWYEVRRRWPNEEGDFLSKEAFSSAMQSHTDLWVTYLETGFQARSDGAQQTCTALLTRLVREGSEVKYVRSYMHINVLRSRKVVCGIFEAAYQCAQKLIESAPARQLANMSNDGIDMESPEYQAAFDALQPEILRITESEENEVARITARQISGRNDDVLFGAFIRSMFLGYYAIMGPRTPDNQQWCVD